MSELRELLFLVKKTLDGSFGTGTSQKVFQEDPEVPREPEVLYALSHRAFEVLTGPDLHLEPTQKGVVVNPRVLAGDFEPAMRGLGGVITRIHENESQVKQTQSEKDRVVAQAEEFSLRVARFFEAFYALAGHPLLASRLRRSSHIRSLLDEEALDSGADSGSDDDPGSEPGTVSDGGAGSTENEATAPAVE